MATVTEEAGSANTEELVAQAKCDDEQSFEQIYRAYIARVFSLCIRILGDARKAEDVTQHIFIRVWSNLRLFCDLYDQICALSAHPARQPKILLQGGVPASNAKGGKI